MKHPSARLLVRLYGHLTPRRQQQLFLVIFLMLISALAEIVSLGAVLPFIGVLAAPDALFRQPVVARAAAHWNIHDAHDLVLPLTILFVVVAILACVIRLFQLWVTTRFTFATGADLSLQVYRRTLYQPYAVHISRSSGDIISGITHKVGSTVLGILMPLMTLLSSAMVLIGIVIALVVVDPVVASLTALCFGGSYGAITWLFRRRLQRNSRVLTDEYTQVVKALQEGLGGIRDVLLDGAQELFCEAYRRADRSMRRAQGENIFLGQSPRFVMEALGMILIGALAYGLSRREGGLSAALPVLGALAIGAQRLMPALQQAYASWATMAGSQAALADTIDLLDQPLPREASLPRAAPLQLQRDVRLVDVCFRYSASGPWVLRDLNLVITKGSRVALVGGTGSGKSTTMDLLTALLTPTEGTLLVDGEPLAGARVRAWQGAIAHVPQAIYLADTTIAANIAFGVPRAEIDMGRVRHAAAQARIAEFIESSPEGYDALVGERGVRLSGGQRQRIGIARALYRRAPVLVLDEATSALDNLTEQSVMEAIQGLDRDLTILLIAHRLTTVRRCDIIVELGQGRVVAQGSYEELIATSASFRDMVQAQSVT